MYVAGAEKPTSSLLVAAIITFVSSKKTCHLVTAASPPTTCFARCRTPMTKTWTPSVGIRPKAVCWLRAATTWPWNSGSWLANKPKVIFRERWSAWRSLNRSTCGLFAREEVKSCCTRLLNSLDIRRANRWPCSRRPTNYGCRRVMAIRRAFNCVSRLVSVFVLPNSFLCFGSIMSSAMIQRATTPSRSAFYFRIGATRQQFPVKRSSNSNSKCSVD